MRCLAWHGQLPPPPRRANPKKQLTMSKNKALKMKTIAQTNRIFVYLSADYVDYFNRCLLPVSRPSAFNDPFEFFPSLDPAISRNEWIEALRTKAPLRQEMEKKRSSNINGYSFVEILEGLPNDQLEELLQGFLKILCQEFRNMAAEQFAVLCCTTNEACPLMWAHYGRKHKGFVVELNSNVMPFSEMVRLKIDYNNYRLQIKPQDFDDDIMSELTKGLASRKQAAWSYENEVRFVFNTKHQPKLAKLLVREKDREFLQIEPQSLKGIIFGINMEETLKVKIEGAHAFQGLTDFYFKQSVTSHSKFEFSYILRPPVKCSPSCSDL